MSNKEFIKEALDLNEEYLIEMTNVRGRYVKNPGNLPFSFYFSSGAGISHGPRVKPMFNPDRLIKSQTGDLKLCDDWEYIPGMNDRSVSKKQIEDMKSFFRKYISLFCAVWDEQMQDSVLQDYFNGNVSFQDMLKDLDFYTEHAEELSTIVDVRDFEKYCRQNSLINLYGN